MTRDPLRRVPTSIYAVTFSCPEVAAAAVVVAVEAGALPLLPRFRTMSGLLLDPKFSVICSGLPLPLLTPMVSCSPLLPLLKLSVTCSGLLLLLEFPRFRMMSGVVELADELCPLPLWW